MNLSDALINDPRDRPFLPLMAKAGAWAFVGAGALYWPGLYRPWMSAVYLAVTMAVLFPPFTLMLHCSSHRQLFQKRFDRLNGIIPLVLAPFFGQSPGTYAAHHMGMHHPENNLWEDESSTLPYRRDSLIDFGRYFGRFMTIGILGLTRYLWRTRRHKLARRALFGELFFWTAVVALGFLNLPATLTVFVAPVLMARFFMMCGNWAQHAFVDANEPGNPYKNSITCIEVAYNDRCFNDGYHIGHHINARLHWSEMRTDYEANVDQYAAQQAIVFRGLDYLQIWALLMVGAYRPLARHVEKLGALKTDEQVIELLKQRVLPVPEASAAVAAPA